MNCDEARESLQGWVDGELSGSEADEVSSHVSTCQVCAGEVRLLRSESKLLSGYRDARLRDADGARTAWPQIEAALAGSAGSPSIVARLQEWMWHGRARQLVYASALVAVTVVVTLVAVRLSDRAERPSTSLESTAGSLAEAYRAVDRAEKEYLEAIRVLGAAVEIRKKHLDPALVVELERNLRAVDKGIEAARKAYRQHGSDPELAHYMLAAYRKKVELLQELAS